MYTEPNLPQNVLNRNKSYKDFKGLPVPPTPRAKTKAYIKNLSSGITMNFLFNPAEWETEREVNYSEIKSPGASYPKFQFVNGGAKVITFDLFLYSNKGDCERSINFLESFLPSENSSHKYNKPPYLLFAWGIFIKKCIMTGYKRKHDEFLQDLGYRKVVVSLTLKVVA